MMKFLRYLIITIVLLAVAVPVIAYIALQQMGTDTLKPVIAEAIEKKTGRTFDIGGDIEIGFGFTPSLSAQNITLSNPKWAGEDALVTINNVNVSLDLRALLQKDIIVDDILVDGVTMHLLQKDGLKSWEFTPLDEPSKDKQPEQADSAKDKEVQAVKKSLVDVIIHDIQAKNVVIYARMDGVSHKVEFPELNASLSPDILLKGKMHYNEMTADFTLDTPAKTINDIVENALTIAVDATIPKGQVRVDGVVTNLKDTPSFKGGIKSNIASLHHVNLLYSKLSLPKTESIIFHSGLEATAKHMMLDFSKVSYGNSNIKGNAAITFGKSKPYVKASLDIDQYSLPNDNADPAPASQSSNASGQKEALKGEKPLPLDGLKAVNADITLALGSLKKANEVLASDIKTTLTLKNGRLVIKNYRLNAIGGSLQGSGVVNVSGGVPSYSLKTQINDMTAQDVLQRFTAYNNVSKGALDVDVNVTSSGRTVRDIKNNLNGTFSYILGDTAIAVPPSASKIGSFLNALRGKVSDAKTADIQCSIGQFTLARGVARTKTLLVDTKGAVVHADGSVNLKSNNVSMTLSPIVKRKGLTSLSIPVRITGPFSALSIAPDAKGVLANLSSVGLGLVKDKSGISQLVGANLAKRFNGNLTKTCLNDIPEPTSLSDVTTKEGLKNIERDVKKEAKSIEKNVRNLRDGLKGDGKNLEKNIRDVRDNLKGLKDLF